MHLVRWLDIRHTTYIVESLTNPLRLVYRNFCVAVSSLAQTFRESIPRINNLIFFAGRIPHTLLRRFLFTENHMESNISFEELGLQKSLLQSLADVGYELPTPIQAKTIPTLLSGRDIIGQAQTGTGKTAAFALPMLQAMDPKNSAVQGLVLTPTRELAIQVAEAIHTYSKRQGGVHVLPVYGGAPILPQIKRLHRDVHIVVGTPGRVMDHLRRGTLKLESLKMIVLDEADEMLKMGFLEDVEWILEQAPKERQTALFSATMPRQIKRVASHHLEDPLSIQIEHEALTVPTIEQRYLNVSERSKLDALTLILGAEPTEAVIVFARTRSGAADLVNKLEARGYAAEAIHGDISQAAREAVVKRLRNGKVDVLVATDVAARGLDVERISHVINYDMPNDLEVYVHRIGRTGRAGRSGVAVLFVTPRERRMMKEIERYTGKKITPMKLPTRAEVAARRVAVLKDSIRDILENQDLELYLSLVEDLAEESGCDMAEIAAAAIFAAKGDAVMEVEAPVEQVHEPEEGMVRLFIAAGAINGVRPADIVGAIANESGMPGRAIGAIDIQEDYTFVELPRQYREQVLSRMSNTRIKGRQINIREAGKEAAPPAIEKSSKFKPKKNGPRRAKGEEKKIVPAKAPQGEVKKPHKKKLAKKLAKKQAKKQTNA